MKGRENTLNVTVKINMFRTTIFFNFQSNLIRVAPVIDLSENLKVVWVSSVKKCSKKIKKYL